MKRCRFFKLGMAFFFSTVIPVLGIAANYTYSPSDEKTDLVRTELLNDGKMHIFFCGTGSPDIYMQYIRKPACLAVIADGYFLLFDAGDGSIQTLAHLKLPYPDLQHIFMTHWHSDHFAGLGMLINARWYSGRIQAVTVYGPYGIQQVMSGIAKAYYLDVLFRAITGAGLLVPKLAYATTKLISIEQLDKPIFTTKTFTVTPFAVDHEPVFPALGYRLNYKGCSIVISGDTRVAPNLEKNARNADVLINEAFSHTLRQKQDEKLAAQWPSPRDNAEAYRIQEYATAIWYYHSDTWELAKMATRAKVKKLVLTHLIPVIPTTQAAKADFTAGMSQYYSGPLTVADDGDELIIDAKGHGTCQVTYQPAKE